ncbi:MAG: MFS transporter [Alphaproteobacteria bacterium]|nr:MFS transporter [Alphaproteobacteria bacterium]MCB9930424.1 MFS transporter [Alphaproteobacteria bacterium]
MASAQSLFVLLLPFYCTPILSFLYRMLNALIAPHLVAEFALSPADLGFITGAFFFGFGVMQLPLGLMLDRYGPRPVVLSLYSVAAAGSVLFVLADGPLGLIVGRFLMGLGAACSMMSGLKAARIWAPADRLPFVSASLFAMTGVGGMLGTAPMGLLVAEVGWRGGVVAILVYSACLMGLIALLVPSAPGPAGASWISQLRELGRVLRSPLVWLVAPIAIASVGTNGAYLSLWAPIWLRDVAGFSQSAQEWALFAMMAATMAGMLTSGTLSQRVVRRGGSGMVVVLGGLAVSLTAQTMAWLELVDFAWGIWPLFAFGSAAVIGLFPLLARRFDPAMAGRVNTSLNCLMFAGSFAAQWGVGLIIDRFPLEPDGTYSRAAHHTALGVMLAIQLAGLLWYVLQRHRMDPARGKTTP